MFAKTLEFRAKQATWTKNAITWENGKIKPSNQNKMKPSSLGYPTMLVDHLSQSV